MPRAGFGVANSAAKVEVTGFAMHKPAEAYTLIARHRRLASSARAPRRPAGSPRQPPGAIRARSYAELARG
jgi:hypothetical protein